LSCFTTLSPLEFCLTKKLEPRFEQSRLNWIIGFSA